MSSTSDLNRLRKEYDARDRRLAESEIYTLYNLANLFIFQQRQREIIAMLRRLSMFPLYEKSILEVGCGRGQVMHEFLGYQAAPARLHGIDLLEHHVQHAFRTLPHLQLSCADGQNLPYKNNSFDIVMQYTAFSSILDQPIKAQIAQEMLRVLSPNGLILWYDFWTNPINPHTKGVQPSEIRKLFPNCTYTFRRITLAPIITRYLSKVSWILCYLLERFTLLNTHYLVGIRKKSPHETR